MISQWKRALVACAFAVFAPLSMAQVISVPAGNVTGGSSISIGFSDSSQAGKTVDIVIGNNEVGPFYQEVIIPVTLDATGKGALEWVVVGSWETVSFSGGGAVEEARGID
ncbi:MAG: hypothetical protein ACI89X_000166 [Planctomycetota bacterium]|jgi:hypothetical protein